MNKRREAGERSDTFEKAITTQTRHFSGDLGSKKKLASSLRSVLCQPYDGICLFQAMRERIRRGEESTTDVSEAELQEQARRNMISELKNPVYGFFERMTEVSKAFKESRFRLLSGNR